MLFFVLCVSSLFFSFVFFMFSLLELVRFRIDMYMSLQPYPASYEAVQDQEIKFLNT